MNVDFSGYAPSNLVPQILHRTIQFQRLTSNKYKFGYNEIQETQEKCSL
jgi:hypothetical protein